MVGHVRFYTLTLLFLCVACSPGNHPATLDVGWVDDPKAPIETIITKEAPSEEKLNFARWYTLHWGIFHVGDMFTEVVTNDNNLMTLNTVMQARGIAYYISKYEGYLKSKVAYQGEGVYVPIEYHTKGTLRKDTREITVTYDESGKVMSQTVDPPENRLKRPAVPEEFLQQSFDPQVMTLVARRKVIEAIEKGEKEFTLPYFDGRRRADMHFTIHGLTNKQLIHVSFAEEIVAGYTNNEKRRRTERQPVIHLYLSPRDFLPVGGSGQSLIGTATARLKKECTSLALCMSAAEE